MSLSSGHGTSSGDLNTGDNLSESSFLEALFGLEFSHANFADDADFYSSDDTEFIRIFPAVAITHGISRRRPVRSLQIPPGIGQSDSTEIP